MPTALLSLIATAHAQAPADWQFAASPVLDPNPGISWASTTDTVIPRSESKSGSPCSTRSASKFDLKACSPSSEMASAACLAARSTGTSESTTSSTSARR